MLALSIVFLLLVLLFLGIPIGFALIFSGSLGIFLVGGIDSMNGILSSTAHRSINSFSLTTIPLFMLMANFIAKSNIAQELYVSILKWIGHLPGGVGVSTVAASAGFGTLSGSSIAATSIMSKICIPEMTKANYKESFSAGLVASTTGTLAALIPPSVPLILYGIQTDTPISKLLVAGIFPAVLLATIISLYIIYQSYKEGSKVEKSTWIERFTSLKLIWPMIVLVIIILGVIYTGIATSTEAAAFGAFGALILGLLMKRLNLSAIWESISDATKQTAMIFTIVIGGYIFAYFIVLTGLSQSMMTSISESGMSKWTILFLIILMYLVLGLFMDLIGSMILTLPIVFPIIISLGFDPVWFGVIVILLLEIGLVTPPVGINLFITSKYSGISIGKTFIGTIPFIVIMLICILILITFPKIVLYLPSKM